MSGHVEVLVQIQFWTYYCAYSSCDSFGRLDKKSKDTSFLLKMLLKGAVLGFMHHNMALSWVVEGGADALSSASLQA